MIGLCLCLCLGLAVGLAQSVEAAGNVYTAAAHPSYSHPVTGEIEDSGGSANSTLGQSMTESVLQTTALVDVDAYDNTYATVRFLLADQISDVEFLVQNRGDAGWMSTEVAVTQ